MHISTWMANIIIIMVNIITWRALQTTNMLKKKGRLSNTKCRPVSCDDDDTRPLHPTPAGRGAVGEYNHHVVDCAK